ncbi:hypothetical protein [Lactiplantibacillus herbarum]|uniref:hypothetical protein n=1 Tax=Lactiplantibacillus herbarum TaxID=1670446 RepID=UPI00064E88CA|nr:hypothetical protein [Lactiplantibacillus herbarum]
MADTALVEHYDDIAKQEAHAILAPLLEKLSREYLLVDRAAAFEILCMSRSYFDTYVKGQPQVKLIERHIPNSAKTFYEPNELKQAVLSIME